MRTLNWINFTGSSQVYSWQADEDSVLVGVFVRAIFAVVSWNPDPINRLNSGLVEVDEFMLVCDGSVNQPACPFMEGVRLNFPIKKNQVIYVGVTNQLGEVALFVEPALA